MDEGNRRARGEGRPPGGAVSKEGKSGRGAHLQSARPRRRARAQAARFMSVKTSMKSKRLAASHKATLPETDRRSRDLRAWMADLEDRGDLKRIAAEVARDGEVGGH